MILVAGGTGRLGKLVVKNLTEHETQVRVLTRDPDKVRHLVGIGVEIAHGDVRDRNSLPAAFAGVDTVVSAIHGFAGRGHVSPRSVDRDGNANLIGAARDTGADFVLVSVVGASRDNPMELFRCKYAAEQHLQASGVPWTIVRATAFVELWADIVHRGVVFGHGDNPINFVSVRDVATLVQRAILDKRLRGQILQVGGPQDLTLNQLADLVHELRGEPVRIHHIPRWLLRAMAPLHRVPRAALTMDTANMTFGERSGTGSPSRTAMREALTNWPPVDSLGAVVETQADLGTPRGETTSWGF